MSIFPTTPLGVKVELLVNGSWTDITSFVLVRDSITITGGKQDESSNAQPAQATLTLNNEDGRFSPNYTGGAYYPFLTRNMQLRISVATESVTFNAYSGYRFWGEVPNWPPQWDFSGTDSYVQITASGPLRRINQGGGEGSALTRYYSQLTDGFSPIAYWPCEEDPDTTIVGAGIDGGTDMTVTTGTPKWKAVDEFNGSAPIGIINNSSWDGLTGSVVYTGDDLYSTPGSYEWTCPPGVTTADVRCVGGGGGGAGSASAAQAGGGAAEWAEETALAVTPGQSYALTVGAGGTGGSAGNGANGGNSTFQGNSVTVTSHGGSGASGATGGLAGTGSTNTVHHNGGAGANAQLTGSPATETFDGSGSWTCPSGVTSVQVECWGGGGGAAGGGSGSGGEGGQGGGGGAYARLNAYPVTAGHTYSFTVGGGGPSGGANNLGSDGSDTHWVSTSTCLAKAGKHSTGPAGAGGAAASCVGDVKFSGGNGGTATGKGGSGGGGSGGSAAAGSNGASVTGNSGGSGGSGGATGGAKGGNGGNQNSTAGGATAPGGGGGGGGGGTSAQRGTYGAHGRVKLTYTSVADSGGGGGSSGGSASAGNTATTQAGAAAVTDGGDGGPGGISSNGSSPANPPGGGGGGGDAGKTGGAGSAGQVEVIYTPPAVPNVNVIRFILYVPKHGGNSGRVLLNANTGGTVASMRVYYQSGGKLQLKGFTAANGGGTASFDSGNISFGANGQTLMVSLELSNSGTSVAWKFTAIQPGASSVVATATGTVTTASVGNVTEVIVAPNADITTTALGHISVQYGLIDVTKVSKALDGHNTEMGVDRFIRLANEQALDANPEYNETVDHWGFETGTNGWGGAFGTVTQSAAQFYEQSHSLLLTADGTGNPAAFGPAGLSGQPVNPGDIVSIGAELYAPVQLNAAYIGIKWFDSGGVALTETDCADTVLSAATWTTFTHTATAPSTAAFFNVHAGDHTTDTAGTLLYIDNVRTSPRMGAQTRRHYRDFLKEVEHLDAGILKEDKAAWGMKYRTRFSLINQTPVVTLDYSAGHLSGSLDPVVDDQHTKNDVTVHRHKGSKVQVTLNDGTLSVKEPPNGSGRYKHQRRVVAERDEQLLNLANHLLNLGTVTDERYPNITVELSRAEVASIMSALAGAEIGDFIEIVNLPLWAPSPTVKQLVIGYTEVLDPYQWTITWNCAPESPYEIAATSIRRW